MGNYSIVCYNRHQHRHWVALCILLALGPIKWMSEWQRAATFSSPRACTSATFHFKWDELHLKTIKYLLYFSGPHTINSKGQWLPPFLKVCSHIHASMQNTSLFLSLIYYGKNSTTCNICKCGPFPSYTRDRQQTAAVNSFNWFQLAATASNFLSLACCWTAHWI